MRTRSRKWRGRAGEGEKEARGWGGEELDCSNWYIS